MDTVVAARSIEFYEELQPYGFTAAKFRFSQIHLASSISLQSIPEFSILDLFALTSLSIELSP